MECPLCGHLKVHKHGKMPSGVQRYSCPGCTQTFNERFDTLYYHRHVSPEQIRQVLQAHSEGSSLRGISRTSGLATRLSVSCVLLVIGHNRNSDDWGGYERLLSPEILHYIGKDRTQRLERTNGIVRQQTGRWHRRQNKRGKLWQQSNTTTQLVVSYFNWIWQHSRFKTTAAQRAGLTDRSWEWHDIAMYPTIV